MVPSTRSRSARRCAVALAAVLALGLTAACSSGGDPVADPAEVATSAVATTSTPAPTASSPSATASASPTKDAKAKKARASSSPTPSATRTKKPDDQNKTSRPEPTKTKKPKPSGPSITVSKTDGLDPDGQRITIRGTGFDKSKGIYVAFCLKPAPGELPSPCGGGVDTSGATGSSLWISSNPPPYGESLAEPYGKGGSFKVTLKITADISDEIDCRKKKCVIATRADHTRTSDRSQDVLVPVTFKKK